MFMPQTIVIMISTLLSFGITTWILSYAFKIVFEKYAGWLPFYVEGSVYNQDVYYDSYFLFVCHDDSNEKNQENPNG